MRRIPCSSPSSVLPRPQPGGRRQLRRVQERASDPRSKAKISEMITKRTPRSHGPAFPVSVDGVVPSEIQLKSLPSEAEELAPQLRGFSYVVVEELVAIVDPHTLQGGNRISEMGKQ